MWNDIAIAQEAAAAAVPVLLGVRGYIGQLRVPHTTAVICMEVNIPVLCGAPLCMTVLHAF